MSRRPSDNAARPAGPDAAAAEQRPDEARLDGEMDDICAGLCEAIDREVARLRREGLPIWVERNGQIVDLQTRGRDASGEGMNVMPGH